MSYRNTQNSLLKKHHDHRYFLSGSLKDICNYTLYRTSQNYKSLFELQGDLRNILGPCCFKQRSLKDVFSLDRRPTVFGICARKCFIFFWVIENLILLQICFQKFNFFRRSIRKQAEPWLQFRHYNFFKVYFIIHFDLKSSKKNLHPIPYLKYLPNTEVPSNYSVFLFSTLY